MGHANTEKPMGITEQKRQVVNNQKIDKHSEMKTPVKTEEKKSEQVHSPKLTDASHKTETKTEKIEDKKTQTEKKPEKVITKKVKKDEVAVNAHSVPISPVTSIYICRFIRNKTIDKAIKDLEEVQKLRKVVPMSGEIPHRKGKVMSGRFPQRAAGYFIKLLKGLKGNADNHDVEEPIITEAIANKAPRPMARFGRWERKRAHITIIARSRTKLKKEKTKTKKKENKK